MFLYCAVYSAIIRAIISKERCVLAITANDLKRNGISGIERAMKDSDDQHVLVDVRGRAKYVILAVEEFNLFREYQLDKAISEAEKCLAAGDVQVIDDLEHYAEQLEGEIARDA